MTDKKPNPEEEHGVNQDEEGNFPADVNTDLDPANGQIADDSLEEHEETTEEEEEEDFDLPPENGERRR
jgi:hypothetical protein